MGHATGPAREAQAPCRAAGRGRGRRIPDLSGRTIGTWAVLSGVIVDNRQHCMCRCLRCGVRRIIPAVKLWRGDALRCRECRIREELAEV